ncbi:hypothetical protein [Streptomyces sp. NPDC057694]|uniref:hypothetical protein n=1 Tax=Streptomyces sp. NPDC057694 TaxID=3346216 RepID=UPI0036793F71
MTPTLLSAAPSAAAGHEEATVRLRYGGVPEARIAPGRTVRLDPDLRVSSRGFR